MRQIVELNPADSATIDRLARISYEAFKENAPDWIPTVALARAQVCRATQQPHLSYVALQDGKAMGWIGLIPGKHVWEIHPLAVALSAQYQGIGQQLVEHAASIARAQGALTLFASTGDEVGTTNLYGQDLYSDPAGAIANLQATGRNPFKFWQKAGFRIVGLLPDAEGRGRPSIHLARRL